MSAEGIERFPTGGNEPILTLDGERIVDAKGRVSRVTTAGADPSLDAYLLMAYLPPAQAVEGTELQVMYMNECYPVTVDVADTDLSAAVAPGRGDTSCRRDRGRT